MALFFFFLLYIAVMLFAVSIIAPLPLSDIGNVRYRTIPWMTIALIITNSLIFMFWQAPDLYGEFVRSAQSDAEYVRAAYPYIEKVWTYGYRGSTLREGLSVGAFVTFTSMFMHGDFWHLFFNMVYLWTFGRRVEDALGSWRFLLFYLFAGMVANVGSEVLNRASVDLPGIGASGAISGVMGAYLLLFPSARILCMWLVGVILRNIMVFFGKLVGVKRFRQAQYSRRTVQVPAWILLVYFAIQNALPSLETVLQGKEIGGVNNLAHIMGFLAALAVFFFVRKDLLVRYIHGRAT